MGVFDATCRYCGYVGRMNENRCGRCGRALIFESLPSWLSSTRTMFLASIFTIIPLVIGMIFYLEVGHKYFSIPGISASSGQIQYGPSFQEINARMIGATDVQAKTYFDTVRGTLIVWTGAVTQVTYATDGSVVVQMAGFPSGNGINAYLSADQAKIATSINRGQQLEVRGILNGWSIDILRGVTYEIFPSHVK